MIKLFLTDNIAELKINLYIYYVQVTINKLKKLKQSLSVNKTVTVKYNLI